jgi:DNA polymerase-3 subunit delta'
MNWGMLGHEWAVKLLREQAARGTFSHAYLFSGAEGVGRRTLALRFAQALNCLQPPQPGEPCRACRACAHIEQMQYPDLTVTQAERVGGVLKVEQVRELQHGLALAPYEGRYRFALLLRFEEAHPSAANALLKTLEEPPARSMLALTAESAEELLPTVGSRCVVMRLRPMPIPEAARAMEAEWGFPAAEARLLAHISGGRPGYAMRLHRQPELLEQRAALLDEHSRLLNNGRAARFAYCEALAKDKERLRAALLAWTSLWRDVALQASGAAAAPGNVDRAEEIAALSRRCEARTAAGAAAAMQRTLDLVERNVNARLACEVLMLDLPKL